MAEQSTNNQHEEFDNDLNGLEFVPVISRIKQIVLLRYRSLLGLLEEFNKSLEHVTRDESHTLRFHIVAGSDKTVFWKASIRITCFKVSRRDESVVDEITLNLNQFLSVHQSLSQQIMVLEKSPDRFLRNSANDESNSSSFSTAKLSFTVPNDNECCICMDRLSNLVLPCAHRFCDECFREWFSQASLTSSQTCPLCRVDVTSDSGFLLTEKPTYDTVKKSLTQSILSLPSDYRNRSRERGSSITRPN